MRVPDNDAWLNSCKASHHSDVVRILTHTTGDDIHHQPFHDAH